MNRRFADVARRRAASLIVSDADSDELRRDRWEYREEPKRRQDPSCGPRVQAFDLAFGRESSDFLSDVRSASSRREFRHPEQPIPHGLGGLHRQDSSRESSHRILPLRFAEALQSALA